MASTIIKFGCGDWQNKENEQPVWSAGISAKSRTENLPDTSKDRYSHTIRFWSYIRTLSIHPSIHLSICLTTYLPTHQPTPPSAYQPTYPPNPPSANLPTHPPTHPSAYLPTYWPTQPPTYLPTHPPTYPYCLCIVKVFQFSWRNTVGMATDYGLDDRGVGVRAPVGSGSRRGFLTSRKRARSGHWRASEPVVTLWRRWKCRPWSQCSDRKYRSSQMRTSHDNPRFTLGIWGEYKYVRILGWKFCRSGITWQTYVQTGG
jgi:hypothetical protein